MKNKIYILLFSILVIVPFFQCADLEEINDDPNRISQISQGSLLSPILYEMGNLYFGRADGLTFDLMQVALTFPSPGNALHRYYLTENTGNSLWNNSYRWLAAIKEMYEVAVENEDVNYQAIALILNSWVYANLTDAFGDVPMTEASRGDEGISQPKFDTQEEIYNKIVSDLEKANELFDLTNALVFEGDILYRGNESTGNVLKWKKFGNSLLLRYLLRISDVSPSAVEKLKKMIASPEVYPVFESHDDSALLSISGVSPFEPPFARIQDFTLSRAVSSFFVELLTKNNDPRASIFFSNAIDLTTGESIGYKGVPSGYDPDTVFDYQPSNFRQAIADAPLDIIIMNYAEVAFIKAELAQKGIVDVSAEEEYYKGIEAGLVQWGATATEEFLTSDGVSYNGTLEQILTQKYVALFFTGLEQWFEYRRTGFPELPNNGGLLNDGVMPSRLMFPSNISNFNQKNYSEAVSRMGGDNINVKVWWDK